MYVTGTHVPSFVSAELYTQIQQFYAWQMGLMDDRQPDRWADTFTEDAIFEEASRMDRLQGRAAIRVAARASADRHIAAGLQMRHWLGMMQLEVEADRSVRSRCYALAVRTPKGGDLEVFASVVCRDHLVASAGGGWLVRHRRLTHDGASGE